MRRVFALSVAIVLVALAACAGTGDDTGDSTPEPSTVVADAGDAPDVAPDDGADAAKGAQEAAVAFTPECSTAGWCTTRVASASAISFTDVWPFEQTAFATGWPTGRASEGTIAEYDGEQWNLLEPIANARAVWAPSADEVWAGGDASLHGALRRGIRSTGTWTWSDLLPEEKQILNIWGTSSDDIYVLAVDDWSGNPDDCTNCNQRLYHVDATGASSLLLEGDARLGPWGRQVADGPAGLWIDRVTGTSSNDVWIVGHRGSCAYLAHKSDDSFVTLADGNPSVWPPATADGGIASACTPVEAAPVWSDYFFRDWVHVASAAPGEIVVSIRANGDTGDRRVHRVKYSSEAGLEITVGATIVELTNIGAITSTSPYQLRLPAALWSPASGNVYVAGFAAVLHNPTAFDDAGAFSYSSVALGGTALDKQFNAIRGTASNNVWVVGDSYALHKTTP